MIMTCKRMMMAGMVCYIAVAQAKTGDAESGTIKLEQVIVSAEKKTESLQDAPISLMAFGAEQLETYGIDNVSDLATMTPSLSIDPFPLNMSTLRMFIRGVGITDSQITQDPAVAVYLDGAYIARSTGLSMDIADLERIEVLRGPQGTLYGRNATGGAVNLITRRPNTEQIEFTQKIGVADRNGYTAKTMINVPVLERAAIKLSWLKAVQDGYVENIGPGGDFGDHSNTGLRVDARWNATDTLTLDYAYDKSHAKLYSYTYQPVLPSDIVPFGPNLASHYNYTDKRLDKLETTAPLLPSYTDIAGHSLHLTWQAAPDTEMRYLFSQRKLTDKNYFDMSGGSGAFDYRLDNGAYTSFDGSIATSENRVITEQRQYSHELQLLGKLFDARVEYIAGAYYFKETGSESQMADGGVGHLLTAPVSVVPLGSSVATTLYTGLNGYKTSIDNEAWALFTRWTWTPPVLDDRLHLTLGGRHSEDERKAHKIQRDGTVIETVNQDLVTGAITSLGALDVGITSSDRTGKHHYVNNSFEFIAEYTWTDDVNVFAKWVEGYKAGGFNTRDPDPDKFSQGFGDEKIQSTELGIKSEWFDRLRLNATAFRSIYSDMQINFLLPNSPDATRVVNAGKAEIRGVETDATWLIARSLSFTLSDAYLDARMLRVKDPTTGDDVSDQYRFSEAPHHSYSAALDYSWDGLQWATLDLNCTYNYTGDRAGSSLTADGDLSELESHGILNLRAALSDIKLLSGKVSVAAWAHNALDEKYPISAVTQQPASSRAVVWGEPRSYGLDVVYNYR